MRLNTIKYFLLLFGLTLISASLYAADDITIGDLTYNFYTSGNAYVKSCKEGVTEVTIPNSIEVNGETKKVTGIGNSAFEGNTTIQKVYLGKEGNLALQIGANAFKGATSLNTIAYTESSGKSATYRKDGVVAIPTSSSLKNNAFEGCTSITTVISVYTKQVIPDNAFKDCTKLDSVALGASCLSIGESAFEGCSALRVVSGCGGNTTGQLEEIGAKAFKDCTSLTQIGGISGRLMPVATKIGDSAFENCTSATYFLDANLAEIGANAFKNSGIVTFFTGAGVYNTHRITLTNNVTKIGESAFEGTPSTIVFFADGTVPETLGANAFTSDPAKRVLLPMANLIKESYEALIDYDPRALLLLNSMTPVVVSAKMSVSLINSNLIYKYVKSVSETDEGVSVEVEDTPEKVIPANTALIIESIATANTNYYFHISPDPQTPTYQNYLTANTEETTLPASDGKINYYTFAPKGGDDFKTFAKVIEETTMPAGSGYLKVVNGAAEAGTTGIDDQKTYTLSVQATGNGTVMYNSTATKNTTKSFTVNHGSSATLTITSDAGYRLASLTVNGTNVTSSVSNNQYTISNITANTTVVATFEQIPSTGLEINATNFPDEAFRNWILQNVSGASDGILTGDEIANVTSIDCSGTYDNRGSIANLQGIEFFTALTELRCSSNQLTSLDISKNTALVGLNCRFNQLTSLDVSQNTALQGLDCSYNKLTSLDVSKNTALQSLDCSGNQLTSLDVSKNTALQGLDCSYNKLTSLDVSTNTVLTRLNCEFNQLTSLDVSKNTALEGLLCSSNQLTSLDVSKNTALTFLRCNSLQLKTLSVYNNTKLNFLYCNSNQLTSLDVSQNTALVLLICSFNQLLNLDLSNNNSINDTNTSIGSQARSLTAVDISAGIAIPVPSEFEIAKVSNLKLNGTTVSGSITSVNGQKYLVFAPKGTAQSSIDGKELTYTYSTGNSFSQAASMDVTVTLSYTATTPTGIEVNSTNFPDEAFRNWVLQNVSGASDGILTDDEIAKVTSINCSNKNISNLQGIEFFTALTTLNCSGNKLSSLDVSKNTALKKLSCQNNKLVSLDVSGCTAITEIECFSNQLTALDVTKNTALTSLNCNSNQLASLDISRNAALVNLYCGSNQLKSLDISNNTALKELNCQINSITNLSGLSADLALTLLICDRNQLKTLDVSRNTALTRLYCHTNQFTSLNVSRNTALTLLYCYNNQLTALDLSKNIVLESLYCDDNQLSKLDVTNNTALKELSIDNNRLTSLDVTKNTALTLLSCVNNLLTNLDVSRNTALSSFWCNNNQLTVLDVSRNTKLTRLDCYGNQLLCLNLGTNTSINDASTSISPQSAALSAQNISEGIAIPVPSDFDYSKVSNLKLAGTSVTGSVATVNGQKYLVFAKTGTAESSINGKMLTYTYNTGNSFNKASSVDVTVTLSYIATTPTGIEVNATNFPDEAFRNWILQNVSGASDGILTEEEIARVTSINCSSYNSYSITTLQGIEFFSALTDLRCHYNQLTVLDVSNNLALNTLICSNNQLIALDVTKNTALTELRCSSNQLTSLDVSKNTALTFLACEFNQLTSLDVSKNTALTELYCNSNQLTSLEVSQNTALEGLYCPSNKLTALDVSKNTALASLYCSSNQLTSLDVSKNTALTSLHCYSNQLTCLELSNNSRLTSASITPQTISLIAEDISEGIAIPVPSDFDLAKVTNLKLNGTSVSGKVATVSEQKYLVFAQPDTPQSTIDGKQLTYDYDTDNSFSQAVFMSVKVQLSYTFMTYSLSIQSGAGGSVSYGGTTITNKTQSFTIAEGSSVTIEMTPSNGYKLASLVVNGTDVTSGVRDNQYTISNITTNTTVVVTYKAIPQTISVDGINYEVKSATDYTLNVGKGNYSGHVVIPATVSYDGDTWTVAGVVDGAFNLSAITAITWNPNTAIGNEAFGAQTNPNLLLYVKSEAYAPTNVQNVIANGRARNIVLTDAASGNDFNCPEAFTAEEISYTHRYGMTTGIGECRGWETIALPFTVQKVMHQTKGQLVTFKQWDQSTSAKPYWLYKLTYTGFAEADFIEANTPYVISMPNHEKYFVDYILAGNVTFSAENATVKTSENMTMPTCNDKTFRPCFAKTAQSGVYAINAVNSWVTNTGGYKEGSVFVEGLRPVLPFEAYMMTNAANAKGIIPIFETQPTAIREIPMQGVKGVRIYSLSGELIMFDENISIEDALKRLKRGVYFVNGKKIVVKLSEK